jgi:hypothetical protein
MSDKVDDLKKEISGIVQHGLSFHDHSISYGTVDNISDNIIYILQRDWGLDLQSLEFLNRPWLREGVEDE